MDWQRATTETQKESRKNDIYEATLSLFNKHGYENVSFNSIAKESNFTKSNMYRYFDSKEDIFLNIFGDMFETWQMHYVSELMKLSNEVSFVDFATTWVNSFLKFPHFLDLTPLLFLTLEKNSSYDQLLIFKRKSRDLLVQISIEVIRIYPSLNQYRAFQLLDSSYAMTSSFWASNFQNESIKKIYKQDDFKFMKPDFTEKLIASLEIFLKGLIINNKNI